MYHWSNDKLCTQYVLSINMHNGNADHPAWMIFTFGLHSFHTANTVKIISEKDTKTTVPSQTTGGTVSQGHVSNDL